MRAPTAALVLCSIFAAACGSRGDARTTAVADSSHHAGPPQSLEEWAHGARIFGKLGDFHRTVTTSSSQAQQYFDQGMRLLWAFNHDEATRSFAKAAVIDPSCAMCYWGVALTVGPNYNLPVMADVRAKVAWDALRLAKATSARGTAIERDLIDALGKRYTSAQPLDPSNTGPVLTAFASAMRDIAARYPGDLDVQVLFAESLMNVNPWKLWANDGTAAPGTADIQRALERVIARSPTHPGANHYYVHAMEASSTPELALAAAQRLRGMMPDAGHLQHMPAHILQRVGRYEDASQSNRDGVMADQAYLKSTPPLDYYATYYAHNYAFLSYSSAMAGRKSEAIHAAKAMRDTMPISMVVMMPGSDWYFSEVYSAELRFNDWKAVIAEEMPDARLTAFTAAHHYARAVAFARLKLIDDASTELAALQKIAAGTPADASAGLNIARDVFAVAELAAKAEIANASGKRDEAIATFKAAAAKEDQLSYDEPSDWFVPVRHQLADALFAANRAAEAERVWREDLVKHPKNGWALFGLSQALRAQKKDAEAANVEREFKDAWKHADVVLPIR